LAFAAYVSEEWPGGVPIVFGAMADKDLPRMLAALSPVARPLILTAAPGKRAAAPADIDPIARRAGLEPVIETSLRRAMDAAWTHGPIVAVAGSLYLAAAVMKELDLAW
jgi:folylpolyglutamate synthase/dihydropteroate synthase